MGPAWATESALCTWSDSRQAPCEPVSPGVRREGNTPALPLRESWGPVS